jgi:hypothetical protein
MCSVCCRCCCCVVLDRSLCEPQAWKPAGALLCGGFKGCHRCEGGVSNGRSRSHFARILQEDDTSKTLPYSYHSLTPSGCCITSSWKHDLFQVDTHKTSRVHILHFLWAARNLRLFILYDDTLPHHGSSLCQSSAVRGTRKQNRAQTQVKEVYQDDEESKNGKIHPDYPVGRVVYHG